MKQLGKVLLAILGVFVIICLRIGVGVALKRREQQQAQAALNTTRIIECEQLRFQPDGQRVRVSGFLIGLGPSDHRSYVFSCSTSPDPWSDPHITERIPNTPDSTSLGEIEGAYSPGRPPLMFNVRFSPAPPSQ